MVSWIMRECDALGRTPPRFGLLKLGTGNALAWVLGAQNQRGRGVVADLARLRSESGSRPMRLLECEEMLTPFGGLGADAIALDHYVHTKDALLRLPLTRRLAAGPASYAIAIATRVVPQFLFGSVLKVRIVNDGAATVRLGGDGQPSGRPIERGETIYEGSYRLLAFSTIPYWGFGARIFPYAQERDDRFHLRVVNHGSLKIVANLPAIWRGTYRDPEVYDFLVDRMIVECNEPTPVQLGGDVIGSRGRVEVALSKRPIQVVDYYSPPTAGA
jgi:diacylglycerol kinase family enzyme